MPTKVEPVALDSKYDTLPNIPFCNWRGICWYFFLSNLLFADSLLLLFWEHFFDQLFIEHFEIWFFWLFLSIQLCSYRQVWTNGIPDLFQASATNFHTIHPKYHWYNYAHTVWRYLACSQKQTQTNACTHAHTQYACRPSMAFRCKHHRFFNILFQTPYIQFFLIFLKLQ